MLLRILRISLFTSLIAACGGTPERAPSTAEQKAAASPESASDDAHDAHDASPVVKRPPKDGTPVIRLLEPGAEPRKSLRYAPKAGTRERMSMEMKMSLAMGVRDLPGEPRRMPATKMTIDIVIERVKPNGDIGYAFELTNIGVDAADQDPELAAQIEHATARLVGMKGSAELSSRGVVERMQLQVPGGVDPATKELMSEMERSMRQLCDPLPEEAIGKGARWDVHSRYVLRSIDIDQVRRYTLLEHAKDAVRLKYIVEQTARPQTLKLPNLPPDARVRLSQLASAGDGQVAFDTLHMVPREAHMGLRTTSVVDVQAEGKQLGMRTDMDVEITISRAAGAGK